MAASPLPSTPLSGVSVSKKWKFNSSAIMTPGALDVRKKLFDFPAEEENENENDNENGQKQWSPTSEYFSQSANEYSSGNSFSDGSPPFTQQPDKGFTTPHSSPCKRPTLSKSATPTSQPIIKKQRLFSPVSPTTPDKFPSSFCSPVRPQSSPLFCSSTESMTNMVAQGDDSTDGMLGSSITLEGLKLNGSGSHAMDFNSCYQPMDTERNMFCSRDTRPASRSQSRIFTSANSGGKRRIQFGGTALVRRGSRGTNINPFTSSELQSKAKSMLTPEDSASTGPSPLSVSSSHTKPHKHKLALRERNVSRYKEEFHEVCVIGSGTFGTVYKCINRLDGCVYALKKSHKPVAGSSDEPAALREVCAHAVLGSHPHLVRYYSAWAEEGHMIIQNEFCDGGNLSSRIAENLRKGRMFDEGELKRLMRHVSLGLQYIHSMGLVHMDIKPDNIFISSVRDAPGSYIADPQYSDVITNEELASLEGGHTHWQFVYKIGDMGLVTSLADPQVEEGDCRYMPRELLQEDYSHLCKVDVFSLGLTVFQAGCGRELPKNGDNWHRIRDGGLPELLSCSSAFNKLLRAMVHNDPAQRPNVCELQSFAVVCPPTQKTKAQLYKELNEEKVKNEMLLKELKQAKGQSRSDDGAHMQTVRHYNL